MNGKLEIAEFFKFIDLGAKTMSNDECTTIFNVIDKDRNGYLTWEQIEYCLKNSDTMLQ